MMDERDLPRDLNAGVPDRFDTEEAAVHLGCSPGHLKNLRSRGDGPRFERLFKRKGVKYTREDIDAWRGARRFGSTTEYPENLA